MERFGMVTFQRAFLLFWAMLFASVGLVQAQSNLLLSKSPDFSTEDRAFEDGDSLFIRVEGVGVDFTSVRHSEYRLVSQDGGQGFEGKLVNNFDGSFTGSMAIADLQAESHLWAWEGRIEDAAGGVFETRVFLRVGDPGEPVFDLRGSVSEVGSDYIAVLGQIVYVDGQIEIVYEPEHDRGPDGGLPFYPGERISLDDIEVGFGVEGQVKRDPASGNLVAERLRVSGPVFVPGHVEMTGRVQEVNPDEQTFVVRDRTIRVMDHTGMGGEHFDANANGEFFREGMLVRVFGEFLPEDGSIAAHFIEFRRAIQAEVEVRGRIRAFENNVMVVQGFSFQVTEETRFHHNHGDPNGQGGDPGTGGHPGGEGPPPTDGGGNDGTAGPPPGDGTAGPPPPGDGPAIDKGLIVRVIGVVTPNGLVASDVWAEGGDDRGMRISGQMTGRDDTGFYLQGWRVEIHEHTQFFDDAFVNIPFDAVEDDQLLMVFGEFIGQDSVMAHHAEYRRPERDELSIRGPIREMHGDSIKVWDVDFLVTVDSYLEGGPGGPATLEDFEVGQIVDIVGVPFEDGGWRVEWMRADDKGGEHGGFRIQGHIDAITEEFVVIQGRDVRIEPHTQFRDRNWQPVALESFEGGTLVEIYGGYTPDGVEMAHEIVISGADREELELWGEITMIEGDNIEVEGMLFTWDENAWVYGDGEQLFFEDLEVGQYVAVMSVVENDGTLRVEHVRLEQRHDNFVRVSGEVVVAEGELIVVWDQQEVFLQFETQIVDGNYQPVDASAIEVGDVIFAWGQFDGSGAVMAWYVEIKDTDKEEISYTGRIDAIEGDVIVIGGVSILLTPDTNVFDGENEATTAGSISAGKAARRAPAKNSPIRNVMGGFLSSTDALEVGTRVEVRGHQNADGVVEAAVVEIRDEGGEVRLSGELEEVNEGELILQGRSVMVGFETEVFDDNYQHIGVEQLEAGMGVEVYGKMDEFGMIYAHRVEMRAEPREEIEFVGRVEDIQGELLVVGGTAFLMTDVTYFGNDTGEPFGSADLAVDQFIIITGERDENGVLVATSVYAPREVVNVWLSGPIQALEEGGLVIQGQFIMMDDYASFFDIDYNPITMDDLSVDQFVFVFGELDEEQGFIRGFSLEQRGANFDEIELNGALVFLENDLVEVNGYVFEMNDNTYISGSDGMDFPSEELADGMIVWVVGRPNSETGNFTAVKMYVNGQDTRPQVRLRGAIVSIDGSSFEVQGRSILLDDNSVIYGQDYEPVGLEELEVEQVVMLFGYLNEDGTITAEQVEALQGQLEEFGVRGLLTAVGEDEFEVYFNTFKVTENTYIQNHEGYELGVAELEPGMMLEVNGSPMEDGTLQAFWVYAGGGNDHDRGIHMSGSIDDLDREDRVLLVHGHKVVVDEWAEVVNTQYERIPFADLQPGNGVRLFGTYEDEGNVRAFRVELRGGEEAEIELRGRISAIEGDAFVVRGTVFVYNDKTHIDNGEGRFIPFSDLIEGQGVGVVGTPMEDGAYSARHIFVATGDEDRGIRVAGRVTGFDVASRSFTMRNLEVFLNEYTEVVGENFERIPLDKVVDNVFANVWGWRDENGRFEAYRIELRNPDLDRFTVFGVLTDTDAEHVYVHDTPFLVTDQTYVGAPEVGSMRHGELFPGLLVAVEAETNDADQFQAKKVQIFGLDPSQSLELKGVVDEAAGKGNSFSMAGIEFVYDDQTFAVDGNWRRLNVAGLSGGNHVQLGAFEGTGDELVARFLRVFDVVQDERSVVGRITSIGTDRISVDDNEVLVNDETVILDLLDNTLSLSDLFVRLRVEIRAVVDDGNLVAQEIRAKPRDRKLTGTIEAISGDVMTIAGVNVQTTVDTDYVHYDGDEISLTDLVAGQTVNVTVTLGAGGTAVAREVSLLPRIEDEVVLTGTVEAVVEDLVIVLGRRFQIIPNTKLLDVDKNPTTLSTYSVGDAVRIRALLLAGDDLVALQIRELEDQAADIRVEGPIVTVNSSTLEVMGVFFFLNENSAFYDLNRNEVTVNDMAEGQTVSVVGEGQTNGTIIATRVSVQNVSLSSGEVEGITADQFSMFGTTFRVDENTLVLGDENAHLDLTQLQDGQYVEVRGVAGEEGSVAGKSSGTAVLVSKVKIIDAEGSGEYEIGDGISTDVDEEAPLPTEYELFQNYPNPFNPVTTIRFALPQNTPISLKVFDVAGREIQTLIAGTMSPGTHEVQWNGRNQAGLPVASGVYLYRLQVGNRVITRRMVLLK